MKFCLTILGVNSAIPAHGRVPTSQILQVQNQKFLIDCGEGCQIRMEQFGIGRANINHIFLSHLHGDHLFGLPGLLYSFGLNRRRSPIHLYAPQPGLLREMLDCLFSAQGDPGFDLRIHDASPYPGRQNLVFENAVLTVHSFPLVHRVPTVGYLFREKQRQLNIIPEKIKEYDLTVEQILQAKSGRAVRLPDGRVLHPEALTFPPPEPRSYAYASDTGYSEAIVPVVAGVDLLYHEATFAHDMAAYAAETMHSTARQAALIALKARVKKLILGHYSSRYMDLAPLLQEAREVFPETVTGVEGETYEIPFRSARK